MSPRLASLLLPLPVVACVGLRATEATRYQGILLSARDLGATPLAFEAERDPTIRRYLARDGRPDFVLVASETDVQLVYVRPSRLVHFHRLAPGVESQVSEVTPLPSSLLHLLPRDLRAGTPTPLQGPDVQCWTTLTERATCRTCCRTTESCVIDCRAQDSTSTSRRHATGAGGRAAPRSSAPSGPGGTGVPHRL